MGLTLGERLKANLAEVIHEEAPNGWFDVRKIDQRGQVQVNLSQNFLDLGYGEMHNLWRSWQAKTEELATEKDTSLTEFLRGEIKDLAGGIEFYSHFTPDQIAKKIKYLQEHDGVDFYGRNTAR